jgi:hypothetical protein
MVERHDPTVEPSLDERLLAAVRAAETDLGRVRAALSARERDAADTQEALDVVAAHWREHKAVHGAVWRLIGEEVREAILAELDGWKRELRAQLGTPSQAREQPRARKRDAPVEHLRARLEQVDAGVERAELLIELGELHEGRHDDPEAERYFRTAEQELAPYRQRATGSGIAEVLVEALPGMVRGDTGELRTELGATMRAGQLLDRVYEGLARVVEDADEAQRYVERRRDLRESLARGSQGNVDFKGKLLEQLSQQAGGDAPDAAEHGEPEG